MSLWDLIVTVGVANLLAFGSSGTMVALLQRPLVQDTHALANEQLLYAYALARVTPGQVNLFVASIGYMVYGLTGAVLCIVAIAVPAYLVLPLMRGYRRFQQSPVVYGFTRGLVSTSVGLLLATSWALGSGSLSVPVAWLVFGATLLLMLVARLPTIAALLIASGLGVAIALLVPGAY